MPSGPECCTHWIARYSYGAYALFAGVHMAYGMHVLSLSPDPRGRHHDAGLQVRLKARQVDVMYERADCFVHIATHIGHACMSQCVSRTTLHRIL